MIPLLVLVAVIGSALFSGLETGFVSLSRIRLRMKARRGDPAAQTLLSLHERPERVLSAFLVGSTLCNVGGGALASAWTIEKMGGEETAGSLIATIAMSATLLIVSEITPKVLFRLRGETAVPRFLWFIQGTTYLFAPVTWTANLLLRVVTGRVGKSPFVTREELRQLVREAHGPLGPRERRMLESVLDFGRTVVREVMLPLPEVVSVPEAISVPDLLELVRRRRYTRIPVYRSRADAIVGLVNIFDVLYEGRMEEGTIGRYVRPIHVVPDTSPIQSVLLDLQGRRETMALVVNEFGGCVGIVTVADIVEEVLGELSEEHRAASQPIQKVADGYVVDATLDIDDLNQELRLSLAKDRFETVGGLVLRRLGRLPRVGERVQVGNVVLEVLAVHAYGWKRIKIRVVSGS
jgi:CBS domain containing-hemolysin-like protein